MYMPKVMRHVTSQLLLNGAPCTVYPLSIELQSLLYDYKWPATCMLRNPPIEPVESKFDAAVRAIFQP